MTEDEKALQLSQERDKLQLQLEEIRSSRMQLKLKSRDDRRAYLQKLGELSFIFGAAISPILVVSSNDISFKIFAIAGVVIYLVSGLLAMWRCRTLVYQDAEDSPAVGIDAEIELQPIIHSYNKLIKDPSSNEYIQEYKDATHQAAQTLTASLHKTAKARIDPTIDIVLYGFILATLLILRTQWPFSDAFYWVGLASFGVVAIFLLLKGYYDTKLTAQALEQKQNEIRDAREKYQRWHDREILGK